MDTDITLLSILVASGGVLGSIYLYTLKWINAERTKIEERLRKRQKAEDLQKQELLRRILPLLDEYIRGGPYTSCGCASTEKWRELRGLTEEFIEFYRDTAGKKE